MFGRIFKKNKGKINKSKSVDAKILTQIDTFIKDQDTIDLTRECIKRAKILGFPILLTSHSDIPEELKEMVDFVEIDYCNPMLEDTNSYSILYTVNEIFEIKIKLYNPDPHAPACLTSIINGSRFCNKKGFDFFLRIEFDTIFKNEIIDDIKKLIESSANTNGLIFSNNSKWIDGKLIFLKSKIYSECFDVNIRDSQSYLDFMKTQEVPYSYWRHLQNAQYHILEKNGVLSNVIIAPTSFLEKSLDKELNKFREKEIGIFRPGAVINKSGESFAAIAHGFSRSTLFEFEIYQNGSLSEIVEQFFVEGKTTFKVFPINPGTLYKIVYKNPITKDIEQWEFTSSAELEKFASITYK